MATYDYLLSTGRNTTAATSYKWSDTLESASSVGFEQSTQFLIANSDGTITVVHGGGFTYDGNGNLTGGTITDAYHVVSLTNGTVIEQITGITGLPATTFWSDLTSSPATAFNYLLSGNDTITASNITNLMYYDGGAGTNTLDLSAYNAGIAVVFGEFATAEAVGGGSIFNNIQTFNGSTGSDAFVFQPNSAGAIPTGVTLNGGAGTDSIEMLDSSNTLGSVDLRNDTLLSIENLVFRHAGGVTLANVSFEFNANQFGGGGLSATLAVQFDPTTDITTADTINIDMGTATSFNASGFTFANTVLRDMIFISGAGSSSNLTITGAGVQTAVTGGSGNDVLTLGSGGGFILAGAGNDTIYGGGGDNQIDGGGGFNIIGYGIASSAATITYLGNSEWSISGSGFSDTLANVEVARFSDKTIALRQPAAGDLLGNGSSDVTWCNPTSGDVGYWSTDGGASAQWHDFGQGSTTVNAVGTGDFNGDGTADILWQNPTNNLVGTWLMNNGTPTWQLIDQGSTTMKIAGIGDFNGDGTSDILWQNPTNNFVGEWQMANGHDTWVQVGTGSTTMNIAAIGDFNGDGKSDILWLNPTNKLVGMWAMNGGTATWSLVDQGSTTMEIVGVGDFNGDGTSDILWENPSNGIVGFWGMANGVDTSWNVLGTANTAYQVAGIGDYNGDGTSDVLWRNATTGDVGIWAMNNGQATWHDFGLSSTAFNVVKS